MLILRICLFWGGLVCPKKLNVLMRWWNNRTGLSTFFLVQLWQWSWLAGGGRGAGYASSLLGRNWPFKMSEKASAISLMNNELWQIYHGSRSLALTRLKLSWPLRFFLFDGGSHFSERLHPWYQFNIGVAAISNVATWAPSAVKARVSAA